MEFITYGHYSKEEWIEHQLETFKGCDRRIITFIANMRYHQSPHKEYQHDGAMPDIIHLFEAGYCYHFAVILKAMFGGTICWLKNRSHIIWTLDNIITDDSIFYDISGVYYDYSTGTVVPVEELGNNLEEFLHREL